MNAPADTRPWGEAPASLSLAQDELHVWRVPLVQPLERIEALHALLAPEERARAARFHFERDRVRFIISRGALRQVLGDYAGLSPTDIRFETNGYGKPALAADQDPALHFNLSHSESLALIAVRRDAPVGIDIERVHADFASDEIAARFFAVEEVKALRLLDGEQRVLAFFRCWTRKEAFIKAIGEGLSYALDSFAVSLRPDEPAALLHIQGDANAARKWGLDGFEPETGYMAAVAFAASTLKQQRYHWR